MIQYLAVLICLGMLVCLLLCVEAGFRIGRRLRSDDQEKLGTSYGVVGGALLGLLGLILGFSYSGAQSRLEARRNLLVQEANAIGTAYLRLDLLLPADRAPLQQLMRDYTDVRIQVRQRNSRLVKDDASNLRTAELQQQIWTAAVRACEAKKDPPTTAMVMPALNEVIDLTTSLSIARQTHLPWIVLLLLIVLSMLSGLLAGRSLSALPQRNWLLAFTYSIGIALTVYVILDLELPRLGLVTLEYVDDAMGELRAGMK